MVSFIASSQCYAGKKQNKLNNDQAVTAPIKVNKTWEPAAFVHPIAGNLPADYEGVDPIKFYETFKARVGNLKKGEFETSAEFTQRTANQDALLDPINTSDLYAFQIPKDTSFKYDADTQTYKIGSEFSGGFYCNDTKWYKSSEKWATCKIAEVSRKYDTYTGSNAYGASRTVKKTEGLDFALAIRAGSPALKSVFLQKYRYKYIDTKINLEEWEKRYTYKDQLHVPIEKARNFKNMEMAILFVGRVCDAKIIEGNLDSSTATIDSPYSTFIREEAVPFDLKQIIYYVVQTGEIIGQITF